LSVLKIDLTYQCTCSCAHCRFRSSQSPSPVIDVDLAAKCMHDLVETNNLGMVVLLGGEPSIYRREMLAVLSEASSLGLSTRLETNACWAIDYENAVDFLKPIVGLRTQVAVSLDHFHSVYIPLTNIVTAIRACEDLGVDCWVDITYLDNEKRDQPEDLHTKELVKEAEQMLGHPILKRYEGPVFFTGRSTDKLAKRMAVGRGIPADPCTKVPWWNNGYLDTADLLNLDPEGYLSKGCGIAFGNVRERSAREIIRNFNPFEHPILSVLLKRGPLGLAEEAAEFGFRLGSDYADRCHLCQEAREYLRSRYPELLVPSNHYRETDVKSNTYVYPDSDSS
jgi:hypothetical protein